jgi:phage/conjugal plasmid C-4 type zinc finger TraR family protein
MADDIDKAQQHIEQELELAIRAARGIVPPDAESAANCAECGNEISSQRMLAVRGCTLCYDCAVLLESKKLRGLV